MKSLYTCIADDLAVDEKTAIATLCITLPKKGVKDALLYISEDFKVRIDLLCSYDTHFQLRFPCAVSDCLSNLF